VKIIEVTNVDFSLKHFLVPLMLALQSQGHDVIGVCAEGPLLEGVRAQGLRIHPIPLPRSLSPRANWRALWALVALFRHERPDLVHAHMPISGFLARLAARIAGVPRVAYTCHGFLFNQPGPLWRRALGLAIEWLGGRLTDVTLTVSQEEAADARRLHIAPNATYVGNGRDPALFRPNPEARARIRAELGTPADQVVIVIVSRLVRHKGYPELLEAMRHVPDAELWVVGTRLPSDHGPDLEPLFAASQLGHRLRRLGTRTDIPDILAAADIFTLPSHFEGLPMSIIEAMLTALPVVATNIRGPRELVLPNKTGLLILPGNPHQLATALTHLVQSPELRTTMAAAARHRATTLYAEAKTLARTIELITLPTLSQGGRAPG